MSSSSFTHFAHVALAAICAASIGCGGSGNDGPPPVLTPTLLYMETPAGQLGRITALNLDGTGRDELTSGANAWAPGDVTPDGSTIAFYGPSGPGADQEIFTMNYNGGSIDQITNDAWQDGQASFLPDGRILFASSHGSQSDIYVMDGDGSNITQLTTNLASEHDPCPSPDGTKVVFSRFQTPGDIWVMNIDGTNPTNLTNFAEGIASSPRYSEDGTKIVFYYSLNGFKDVMVMDANGANRTNITSADQLFYFGNPAFSLDGQHIYATAATTDNGSRDIYRMDVGGGNRVQITNTTADEVFLRVVQLLR